MTKNHKNQSTSNLINRFGCDFSLIIRIGFNLHIEEIKRYENHDPQYSHLHACAAFSLAVCNDLRPVSANNVPVQEAQQIAEDAYIYGYPLITMEMTRRVMTNWRVMTNLREPER